MNFSTIPLSSGSSKRDLSSGCISSAENSMKRSEWRKELGALVRDAMLSPELDHYFKVKITKPGARVLITQLGLFIHHRRDCWAHVSGNCPHMSVTVSY